MLADIPRELLATTALGVGALLRSALSSAGWQAALAGARPRRPLVIAHRGSSSEAPENTLRAFRLARTLGADAIELDIRRCRTGELVVMHDADLLRMTGTPLRVAECPLEMLRRLRIADRDPIPTLEDVLTDPDCPALVNVEIKAEKRESDGIEQALVDLLKRIGARERVIVSSFNPYVLARMAALEPTLPRGLLYARDLKQPMLRYPFTAPYVRPHLLHPHYTIVTPAYMQWARRLGYPVLVWTVDEPAEWVRLSALEVDGIITNRPAALLRQLMGPMK